MTIDMLAFRTSAASPGQNAHRERLLRLYDEMDDIAKQELLQFAQDLSEVRYHAG